MSFARLREQDGLIHNSIKIFVVVVVFFVVLLDSISLFAGQRTLRGNVYDAAVAASDTYGTSASPNEAQARATATAFLQSKGDQMLAGGFSVQPAGGQNLSFSVTGTRHVKTYVAHYLTSMPGIGDTMKRWLDPVETGTSVRQ